MYFVYFHLFIRFYCILSFIYLFFFISYRMALTRPNLRNNNHNMDLTRPNLRNKYHAMAQPRPALRKENHAMALARPALRKRNHAVAPGGSDMWRGRGAGVLPLRVPPGGKGALRYKQLNSNRDHEMLLFPREPLHFGDPV